MIEAMSETPSLSVVMVVGEERERARRAVAAVAAQSVAAALELVVVDLRPDRGPVAEGVRLETTVLERPGETSWSAVRHAGAVAARAPVVAFVEDHVYAEPAWAEALLDTYDTHRDAVAVGYAFANARDGGRPDGTLFAEYGRWIVPAAGGRWSALPGNNVSYRRDALLELAKRGAGALAVDFTLHAELLRRGSFLVAPGAVVRHEGFPRLIDTMRRTTSTAASWPRRASPVDRGRRRGVRSTPPAARWSPLLNAARLARTLPGRGLWGSALRSAPTCLAIWAAAASGELVGYVTVSGAEGERLLRWEVDVDRTTS